VAIFVENRRSRSYLAGLVKVARQRVWVSPAALSFGAFLGPGNSSRVARKKESADKPGSVLNSHSSGTRVTAQLKRPTRKPMWATCSGLLSRSLPYLVLLQVGFAVPQMLPPARCALTAPFHPYRRRLRGA
jgi:hypothetical protein